MGRLLTVKRGTLFGSLLVLTIVGVLPVLLMLWSSFRQNGAFTLRNYVEVFGAARTWTLFGNSILLATAATVLAGALGIALGLLIGKTDLPFRNTLAILFGFPLLFPPYVLAIGWFELLGRGGLMTQWFGAGLGSVTSNWLFGLPGAAFVLGSAFLPIVLILTITSLQNVEPSLEEAARLSSTWRRTLKLITIPLIRPGVSLGMLLVFLLSMGELGAPGFLRVNVLPVASFTQLSAFYDFGAATAAAVPFVVIVLIAVSIAARTFHEEHYVFRWIGSRDTSRVPLGRTSPMILSAVLVLALVVVGMPIGGVLWRGLSIPALAEAVARGGESAIRTLLYAGAASCIVCLLTFFVAYAIHRRTLPGWRLLHPVALFLFALPGAIIGIGLITLWNRPSFGMIYASPALLIMGFVAQYAAIGMGAMLAGLSQLQPSLEEAAEISGASWFQRMFRILFPLLRPAMLAAACITFIFCLRDLSLPLLLAPPGGDTLTARTMTLMANGSPDLIAALCVLSLALAVIPLGALRLAAWWARSKQV